MDTAHCACVLSVLGSSVQRPQLSGPDTITVSDVLDADGCLCDDGCCHGDEGTCGGRDAQFLHSAALPVYGDHAASATAQQ